MSAKDYFALTDVQIEAWLKSSTLIELGGNDEI